MKLRTHDRRGTIHGVRVVVYLLAFAFSLLAAGRGRAQEADGVCAGDRASFLYAFAQFVRWPGDDHQQPLVIGVIGDDPLEDGLRLALDGRTINGRPVLVRRVVVPIDVRNCAIAYVGHVDIRVVRKILAAAAGTDVLTVSELPRFDEMGGIVQFIPGRRPWRFAVNYPAARRGGLWISSALLNLTVADVGPRQ